VVDYVWGLEHLNYTNRPAHFRKLFQERQAAVVQWIQATFEHATSTNSCPGTSYGLKHWFENQLPTRYEAWKNPHPFYMTNGQFKGAMLAAGFEPIDPHSCNSEYKIKLSKTFRKTIRDRQSKRVYRVFA